MSEKQKPGCHDNKKNKPEETNVAPGTLESHAMKNKRDKETYQHDPEEADKDQEEPDNAVEKKGKLRA